MNCLSNYRRHDAQECYCGEPNCVGYIGGKTQTDIAGMDDLYLDGKVDSSSLTVSDCVVALGITDYVNAHELRGKKGKKGKQLDIDFTVRLSLRLLAMLWLIICTAHLATDHRCRGAKSLLGCAPIYQQ